MMVQERKWMCIALGFEEEKPQSEKKKKWNTLNWMWLEYKALFNSNMLKRTHTQTVKTQQLTLFALFQNT